MLKYTELLTDYINIEKGQDELKIKLRNMCLKARVIIFSPPPNYSLLMIFFKNQVTLMAVLNVCRGYNTGSISHTTQDWAEVKE